MKSGEGTVEVPGLGGALPCPQHSDTPTLLFSCSPSAHTVNASFAAAVA